MNILKSSIIFSPTVMIVKTMWHSIRSCTNIMTATLCCLWVTKRAEKLVTERNQIFLNYSLRLRVS